MNFFQIIFFGIIEGITEFLPVSSTAHLDIARFLMNIPNSDFIKSFEITIQLGAILAVVFFYKDKLFSSGRFSFLYIRNILIAFLPTGIIGFLLYKFIKSFLLGNTILASSVLVIGGVIIILFERNKKNILNNNETKTIESLSIKQLLLLGCAQSLAVIPGVSRSGAVIVSGRAMNLSKELITEFSFLLAIPTMLSAVLYDLYKSGFEFDNIELNNIAFGFVVSFVVALFVIKWLISYIERNSFEFFGWYRIIFGLIILIFFI